MSRPEDRNAMMLPQDATAENKNRKASEMNWSIHGGNLESFGEKGVKKKPTDEPPNDLPFGSSLSTQTVKLPPKIVTHDKDGLTTGSHSANDERFSNVEAENIRDSEPSINSATPIEANKNENNVNNQETEEAKSKASSEAHKRHETAAEKEAREMRELEEATRPDNQSAPVDQNSNTTANSSLKVTTTTRIDPVKPTDPVLTTR